MWVILRVNTRKAKQVAEELHGYLPCEPRTTKPKNKRKPVKSLVPIFPSWVFVEYSPDLWNKIAEGVGGVYGAVKLGRTGLLMLSDHDMSKIRDIEDRLREDLHPRTETMPLILLEKGDKVAFETWEIEGIVDSIEGEYANVLIDKSNLPIKISSCLLTRV